MAGFCANCGHALGERAVEGKLRPACPACGTVVYADPKLAVAVLLERGGKILLGRRSPGALAGGKWSFPAGFVDRGERVEDAALREVREETGLDIRLDALIGLYSATGQTTVLVAYAGSINGGTLGAADDLTELAFFPLDRLPEPAFAHDPQILADWRVWRDRRRADDERTDA